MYEFRDVNENITSTSVPAEALQLNGSYLETEIEGYRTLYVTGREALSPEIETIEIGTRDGSVRKSKRYPARTITVGYQLVAADAEAFRAAYNRLAALLDVNDAELIFNDEPDVYFIGTPSEIGEVDPGLLSIKGEIDFLCLDPFKYSVVEYEATAMEDDPRTIIVDYNGTHKVHPILEADFYKEVEADGSTTTTLTGNGDCGYVAFFTEDEKIIQLGDPDEEDGETIKGKSATLVNQTFTGTDSWGSAAQGLFTQNAGITLPTDATKAGSLGMKTNTYSVPASPAPTSGTILSNAMSDVGSPYAYYTVSLYTYGRTSNAINVRATITGKLRYAQSYMLNGIGLKASLYCGGSWHSVTLKKLYGDPWRGKTAHTVSMTFTVTGLSSSTASLTGIQFKVEHTDSYTSAGKLNARSCSNLAISTYAASVPDTYYLGPSYGSGTGYHGPTIKRTVDASQDCTLSWTQRMCIGDGNGSTLQMGAFFATLADASGNIVAGLRILKNEAGKFATAEYYVNGVKQGTRDIDLSYNNKTLGGESGGTSTINKNGALITFTVGSYQNAYTVSAIKDTAITQVTLGFQQYGSVTALTHNGLTWVRFIQATRDTWHNIQNKFSANDVLTADCSSGEIMLNGNETPALGAIGNEWDAFVLTPGLNQIGTSFSSWVADEYAPTMKVRYREAFL